MSTKKKKQLSYHEAVDLVEQHLAGTLAKRPTPTQWRQTAEALYLKGHTAVEKIEDISRQFIILRNAATLAEITSRDIMASLAPNANDQAQHEEPTNQPSDA